MDEKDGELTEVEERLFKLIEAQSKLLKEFISETERRLEELERTEHGVWTEHGVRPHLLASAPNNG